MGQQSFHAEDVWEKLGITEHLGGFEATERLIQLCKIKPAQYILDIGCGTAYTACLLARDYGAKLVAADKSESVLERAKERVQEQSISQHVSIVRADIHSLGFPDETFDVVFAESVLVFCDKAKASAEIYRVLKRGGIFGDNEFSYLKPPPNDWKQLLSSANFGLELQPLLKDEWCKVFQDVGLSMLSSEISRLSLGKQFSSHIRVDGWRRYLSAMVRGLAMPAVWKTFFNRDMLCALQHYPEYVGYGLYVSVKR